MNEVNLEILVSTMNRTDLSFLEPMFPGRKLSEFHLLIINQTTKDKILKSEFPNIRVINSFETGLSKSRNLALKNSIGKVALIADDDIVYLPKFDEIVLSAFWKYTDAVLIQFQMRGAENGAQKKYIHKERRITSLLNQPKPSSVEMALRPAVLVKNELFFNEFFGLGAVFPSGEESLFVLEILKKELEVYHVPELIVEHLKESTGSRQGNEQYIWALSGLKYLEYGAWSRLWLLKFIFFLVRGKQIPFRKTAWAYGVGRKAIERSKEIFGTDNPLKTKA